jgi:hypothetical protein
VGEAAKYIFICRNMVAKVKGEQTLVEIPVVECPRLYDSLEAKADAVRVRIIVEGNGNVSPLIIT